ncbi:MAG: hypothetical protein M3068_14735 [Gemmatimonadota bacterium]|nr:hypothetical protein [Gemmatimonadota bacterium]
MKPGIRIFVIGVAALFLALPFVGRFATVAEVGAKVEALVGAALGVAVYISATRRQLKGREHGQHLGLLGMAFAGIGMALVVAMASSASSSATLGESLSDAAMFGSWDSLVICVALAAMRARRHDRTRSSHRRKTAGVTPPRPMPLVTPRDGPRFPRTPERSGPHAAASDRSERECPWCAERILARARVCKHCGREVESIAS